MIGKPGPFQVIENGSLDVPHDPPKRRYSCLNYDTCLNLAAALNWDSFTCRGCSGNINESLFWRARTAYKKDSIAKSLCILATEPFAIDPPTVSESTGTDNATADVSVSRARNIVQFSRKR